MHLLNQQFFVAFLLSLQFDLGESSLDKWGHNNVIKEEQWKRNSDAGHLVVEILETYFRGCHKLLVSGGSYSPIFDSVLGSLNRVYESQAIATIQEAPLGHDDSYFQKMRIGEEKVTCRTFVFDLSNTTSSSYATEFMDNIELFLIPETAVIFMGKRPRLEETLMSSALRNTKSVLYIVQEEDFISPCSDNTTLRKEPLPVVIYSRCLFCNSGQPGIEMVDKWTPTKEIHLRKHLFRDQFLDFQGYQMRITQMNWFPLAGFTVDSDEVSSTVTPVDTLHVRILKAVAGALNFTYEMRLPWDCQWGVSTPSGNWTGIIGTLQHHKADFGMAITYNLGRMKVVDFTRILMKEPVIMVMSKPRPPPPYLAIIHPFKDELWGALAVSCLSGGMILGLLQMAWEEISRKRGLAFDVSFLLTFGGILQEPTTRTPKNTSGLVYLAFWWIYCLLMTVTYKSSLIAHLSVPGKSKSIDSLEEMLQDPGWTWGYADNHSGTYDLFRKSDSPVIKQVFQGMQIQPNDQQVERILKEKHVLIVKEFLFKSLKSTIARNHHGSSPFYYGKSEYFANGDGWTFRQNAPFFNAIDMKLQQLAETGHISHWLKQLIGTSPEDICEGATCKREREPLPKEALDTENSGQVVLTLSHLQSAFYVIPIGIILASPAFIAELFYYIVKG